MLHWLNLSLSRASPRWLALYNFDQRVSCEKTWDLSLIENFPYFAPAATRSVNASTRLATEAELQIIHKLGYVVNFCEKLSRQVCYA